jgi:Tol biopolymer transport system component
MIFRPKRNLSYHTRYTVTVSTGATDPSGKHILRAYRTSFTTQSPHLMYLGSAGDERNRLVLASIGGRRQVVGPNDGLVSDYSLSFDSSLVVYVKAGSAGERADELWLLSLADNSTQRVFRRTDWSISQPHLSPDNSQVVFLAENVRVCRQYYGCFRDRRPEVYFLDLRSGEVHLSLQRHADFELRDVFAGRSGGLHRPELSLDPCQSRRSHALHIPNSGNSPEFAGFDASGAKAAFVGQTPESQGGDILVYAGARYQDVSRGVYDSSTPAFATSGKRIAYAGYSGEKGIEPVYGISVYSFATHRTQHLTNDHDWSDWTPAWSLDDHYLAFIRSVPRKRCTWVRAKSG